MKKVLLIVLLLTMLFVVGCEAYGTEQVGSEYDRNNQNIERYERMLASGELSARERRTVQWYLDAAIEWRDNNPE